MTVGLRISAVAGILHTAAALLQPPVMQQGGFSHARHAKVACLACHQTGAGHGRLTFQPPGGCAACHHKSPTPDRCATCHRSENYGTPKPRTVTVTVPRHEPAARTIDFLHERHSSRTCVECHATPVTLALAPANAECKGCHSEHHAAGRNCSACHRIAEPKAAHRDLKATHQRCDACHTAGTIERLTPVRSFCITCHAAKNDHYATRECTTCHFLATPETWRSRLLTRPPG